MLTATVVRKGNTLKLMDAIDIPEGKPIRIVVPDGDFAENFGWLTLSEKSFEFWDNEEDEAWNNV